MTQETVTRYRKNTIVLRNSGDEITFADVSCQTDREMTDTELREAVSKAVSEWIAETEDGKKAWEYSCEDFNIGDLACRGIDDDLKEKLEKVGVYELHISTHSFEANWPTPWSYDDILGESPEEDEEW